VSFGENTKCYLSSLSCAQDATGSRERELLAGVDVGMKCSGGSELWGYGKADALTDPGIYSPDCKTARLRDCPPNGSKPSLLWSKEKQHSSELTHFKGGDVSKQAHFNKAAINLDICMSIVHSMLRC
jgi:hypothetical protein